MPAFLDKISFSEIDLNGLVFLALLFLIVLLFIDARKSEEKDVR
jgi:hypothetical protein